MKWIHTKFFLFAIPFTLAGNPILRIIEYFPLLKLSVKKRLLEHF